MPRETETRALQRSQAQTALEDNRRLPVEQAMRVLETATVVEEMERIRQVTRELAISITNEIGVEELVEIGEQIEVSATAIRRVFSTLYPSIAQMKSDAEESRVSSTFRVFQREIWNHVKETMRNEFPNMEIKVEWNENYTKGMYYLVERKKSYRSTWKNRQIFWKKTFNKNSNFREKGNVRT